MDLASGHWVLFILVFVGFSGCMKKSVTSNNVGSFDFSIADQHLVLRDKVELRIVWQPLFLRYYCDILGADSAGKEVTIGFKAWPEQFKQLADLNHSTWKATGIYRVHDPGASNIAPTPIQLTIDSVDVDKKRAQGHFDGSFNMYTPGDGKPHEEPVRKGQFDALIRTSTLSDNSGVGDLNDPYRDLNRLVDMSNHGDSKAMWLLANVILNSERTPWAAWSHNYASDLCFRAAAQGEPDALMHTYEHGLSWSERQDMGAMEKLFWYEIGWFTFHGQHYSPKAPPPHSLEAMQKGIPVDPIRALMDQLSEDQLKRLEKRVKAWRPKTRAEALAMENPYTRERFRTTEQIFGPEWMNVCACTLKDQMCYYEVSSPSIDYAYTNSLPPEGFRLACKDIVHN